MSLVNLTPAVTATVLDPILYDSGWKQVSGTGSTTTIETLKYDVDSVVRIFAKHYKTTVPNEWKIHYSYNDSNSQQSHGNWQNLNRIESNTKTGTSQLELGTEYLMQTHASAYSSTNTSTSHNASGMSLKAGWVATFQSTSSASTSDGIEYRIIVERSTSAVMLGRALGKPQ
tara:strand:+ start:780 stop:1295 length:516 start_codon:yes stop_codon:yes gene_type:complete